MPDLPPNSTILVTGANGYIASNIIQALITANHKVIGTVRSPEKCAWLSTHFPSTHFTLHHLPTLSDTRAYERAIKKYKPAAMMLTTFTTKFDETDPDALIPQAINDVLAPLSAAAQAASPVQSITITGSAWSIFTPRANTARTLTPATWNAECLAAAYAPTFADPATRSLAVLMASKTRLEQAAWAWVRERSPAYRFNVVQVETAFGAAVAPGEQGSPSTAGLLKMVFWGRGLDFVHAVCGPQWFVHVRDAALLHVACAVGGAVDRERLFGFAARYCWADVLAVMADLYPGREFVGAREGEGVDLSVVPNGRALELLRAMGRDGWRGLRESVKDTVDGFLGEEEVESEGDAFGFYSK